jgi:hypothetical protein
MLMPNLNKSSCITNYCSLHNMNTSNHGKNQYVCWNGSIDCRYTSQAQTSMDMNLQMQHSTKLVYPNNDAIILSYDYKSVNGRKFSES